jgi:hypothetical protein
MRQPGNLPAFCRVRRNGRPLIGMCGRPGGPNGRQIGRICTPSSGEI